MDGFSFIDPWKFLDQIYGSQFGLANAQTMFSHQYGVPMDKFGDSQFGGVGMEQLNAMLGGGGSDAWGGAGYQQPYDPYSMMGGNGASMMGAGGMLGGMGPYPSMGGMGAMGGMGGMMGGMGRGAGGGAGAGAGAPPPPKPSSSTDDLD